MRILVTLGTQDKEFNRLIKKVEPLALKHQIIVQAGCSSYRCENITFYDFLNRDQLLEEIQASDIVVTHGGVGIIMQALKAEKKVIAMARLKKYGEHQNDHQTQILDNFYQEGYLKIMDDQSDLETLIEESLKKEFKKISYNNQVFVSKLESYLKQVL